MKLMVTICMLIASFCRVDETPPPFPPIPPLPIPVDGFDPDVEGNQLCCIFFNAKCSDIYTTSNCGGAGCDSEEINTDEGPQVVWKCSSGIENSYSVTNPDAEYTGYLNRNPSQLPVGGFEGALPDGQSLDCGVRWECKCDLIDPQTNIHYCSPGDGTPLIQINWMPRTGFACEIQPESVEGD